MPSSSKEATQLKLKALELKKAGDIEGAKSCLARAREIEFEHTTVDQLNNIGDLKRLAVVLKRKGDIAGAKEALLKAKQLEQSGSSSSSSGADQTQTKPSASVAQQAAARIPCLYNIQQSEPPSSKDAADDGRATNYLAQTDSAVANMKEELNPTAVSFDDDEMVDTDVMVDLKQMGMDVPSEAAYHDRIKANKIEALAAKKRGDLQGAKKFLLRSKQLEAARIALYAAMDEDNDDEDDGEDYSLLDELNDDGQDDSFYAELFGPEENVLDLDDLDDFDPQMLKDMIDCGMEVPDPNDVLKEAQEKKQLALSLHKDGNKAAATAALAESKRLQSQAERLAEMLDAIESGNVGDEDEDMDALMAMLEGSENGGGSSRPQREDKSSTSAPLVPERVAAEPSKSAGEWKLEAVRCKKEGNLTEATKALRMYKQALAEESKQAEREKRRQLVADLTREVEIAKEQLKRFAFYERFVDQHVGKAQLLFWNKYENMCITAIKLIEQKGSNCLSMSRSSDSGGVRITNEDLSFVGKAADPTDDRLEVAIMEIQNIGDNKHLKKILRHLEKEQQKEKRKAPSSQIATPCLRVDVTFQLPRSEKESDSNITLNFEARPVEGAIDMKESADFKYETTIPSQFVNIARGKSRLAKTVLRRMERKRIQINCIHVPKAKKGFFGTKKDSSENETNIGSVTIELKEFLDNNCVAGDFPLMDAMRRNELGGTIRLGMRTGRPFDPKAALDEAAVMELTGYELKGKELNRRDGEAADSESIETESYAAMSFVMA